jgi:N-acetylated-alpha-linked acidic dipeptidase
VTPGRLAPLLLLLLATAAAPSSGPVAPDTSTHADSKPPLGFGPIDWKQQAVLESEFAAGIDRARLSTTHRSLTAQPHRAGTEGARRTTLYLAEQIRRAGFEPEVVTYLFYNSHPGPSSIALTAPESRPLSLVEDRIPGDPFTLHPERHPAFCAYSGSGSAEGEVVYAGQGTWEDFAELDRQHISLKGRVALMRYFGAGEGTKVRWAEERGAVAAVLYADPAEDGFVQGPVYPKGDWRPPGAIMRRSVIDTPYDGDPLSPGWAARPGAERLDPAEVVGLPSIPVLPISYRDARRVLSRLQGPQAPERMRGGLEVAYRLGPGPARLKLSVRMEPRTDTIRDVIVRIPGREEPEAWVILGNHHDAWIYGAGDPSSGTAALLEEVRALGRLRARGWRPRRTLVVAFWDAEEMNLGGSTEWVEEHAGELRRRGVAAINMDSAVFNPDRPLYVGASACLHRLFRETADAVPAPRGGGSLGSLWLRMQNEHRGEGTVDGRTGDFDPATPLLEPYLDPVPLGDDQTPFVAVAALPGSDMYYGADYGMYHSLYEDRHWMMTVVDPEFRHHRAMAELQGRVGLRLAMAPILPLDPAGTAAAWETALADLEARAAALQASSRLLRPVRRSLRRFREAADSLGRVRDQALASIDLVAPAQATRLAAVNLELAAVERSFYEDQGLPDLPYYHSIWAAPPRPVPGLTETRLPGLRWALERKRGGEMAQQVGSYTQALDEATAHLHRAEGILAALLAPSPSGAERSARR